MKSFIFKHFFSFRQICCLAALLCPSFSAAVTWYFPISSATTPSYTWTGFGGFVSVGDDCSASPCNFNITLPPGSTVVDAYIYGMAEYDQPSAWDARTGNLNGTPLD